MYIQFCLKKLIYRIDRVYDIICHTLYIYIIYITYM